MNGARLQELRKKTKHTQQSLADELGVSVRTITFLEAESREPSMALLMKLADYFNVSTDYLLGKEKMDLRDDDIKFAVFGDPDVTDEQFEEIKKIARIIRERDKQ